MVLLTTVRVSRSVSLHDSVKLNQYRVERMTDPWHPDRITLVVKAWSQLPRSVQGALLADNIDLNRALQDLEDKHHAAIVRRAYVALKDEREEADQNRARGRQIEDYNRGLAQNGFGIPGRGGDDYGAGFMRYPASQDVVTDGWYSRSNGNQPYSASTRDVGIGRGGRGNYGECPGEYNRDGRPRHPRRGYPDRSRGGYR